MKTMIKDMKPIKVKKTVIKIKDDKKVTEDVIEDAYLVTMMNGNSVALTKKQMKELNINDDGSIKNEVIDYEEEEDDDITEEVVINTNSNPKFSTNIQKDQKEVISSSNINK